MTMVSAPASAANLGPGFDVLALALDLRLRLTVERSADWSLVTGGEPGDTVSLEMVRAAALRAVPGGPPLAFAVESAIPVGRGLGSSAALRVAAVAAARAEAGLDQDPAPVRAAATEVEGHPDNVAAAVHGGLLAVSWAGMPRRLELHPSLIPLVAVPDATLETEAARSALGDTLTRGMAVRSVARAVLLVEGLRTADRDAFLGARGDEMHEAQRAPLSPLTADLVSTALQAGALHAAWSGAGPAAVAFVDEDSEVDVRLALEEVLDGSGTVVDPGVAHTGVEVE
jgi:homoserine kinase